LDEARLLEALPKCAHTLRIAVRRYCAKESDHRRFWLLRLRRGPLLRARRERPYHCHAAEQRDELASLHHSITSSARKRIEGGIVSSRDFAAPRFSANSNFVGCSTGRSAGLTPLRTFATIIPNCRQIAARLGP